MVSMSANPCQICGCIDLNLVDGFYYCVECGTQDVNVRETIVEQTMLADGTLLIGIKKLYTVLKDAGEEMSGEWHKWHAYNFILAGLTEELIALGANPTVKMRILWVWQRYIKKFQEKDNVGATQFEDKSINEQNKSPGSSEEDSVDTNEISEINIINQNIQKSKSKSQKKKNNPEKFSRDIKIVTKGMLLTILYVALNLDKSDIQLTHLFRFIREGRLSIYSCIKFVPKELSVKLIPHWINFVRCHNEYTPRVIRAYAMTIFKRLDLGVPLVPDLNKIINSYIQELCLPSDFKDLVLSLIHLMPCNSLQLEATSLKCLLRVPDYEGVCMSYVLLALKMCFGLDCDYEVRLSDEVDKINYNEDHLRSYKIGTYSVPTDRLFSFREWSMFLQFRKIILCRYYLPMARQYNLPADDCVYMENLEERNKRKIRLSDEVTMDILNKIPLEDIVVIPKNKFAANLTPMTTYTEVISDYIQDPELKLRLCEDFSQYSLKYVTKHLKFSSFDSTDLVKGVGKTNKVINPRIIGTLITKKGDSTMILVRNCENKNWLKTKPPTTKHITKKNTYENSGDKESDHGYNSSIELTDVEKDEFEVKAIDEDSEADEISVFEEEDEGVLIFDDDFRNLVILEDDKKCATQLEEIDEVDFQGQGSCNLYDSKLDISDTFAESSAGTEPIFNLGTFDREGTIQKLIESACRKYKIPLPKPKETKEASKRKYFVTNETRQNGSKRRKSDTNMTRPKSTRNLSKGLVEAYYKNLHNDVLMKISQHVRSVIQMADDRKQVNDTHSVCPVELDTGLENFQRTDDPSLHEIDSSRNSIANDNSILGVTLNGTIDDEDNNDALMYKGDPKFDAKTHDIDQLYIKLNDEFNFLNYTDVESDDPEVDELIDKKILEYVEENKNDNKIIRKDETSDTSDSEDEQPLSVVLAEKLSYMTKKSKVNFEYLIDNSKLKKFGYWMKHYKTKTFTRNLDMNQKFNIELSENSPISFVFVIRECAAVLSCTTFCLYKCLQTLEQRLSSHLKK